MVVALLDGFLRVARSLLLAWRGMKYEQNYSMEAFDKLLHADLVSFESRPHGVYLDRLHSLEHVREFYYGQSILMVVDLPFVLLFPGLIYVFAGNMVLIPISVIGTFLIVSIVTAHFLRQALRMRSDMDERKQNFLIEALQGIHTLKAMAMESQMARRFERLQGQSADSVYLLARVNSIAQALGVTFSQVVMVSFLTIGSMHAVSGDLTIGALAAGTMLAGRVLQPALKAMSLWTQLQSVRLAKEKFEALLQMPQDEWNAPSAPVALRGELELRNISFRHPGDETDLIRHISLHIDPGEAIGISGNNGTGKSTLLNLIVGFVHPSAGEILVDGRNLEEVGRQHFRSQVGFVPQRGVLFSGTLLENMTLFREGEAVDEALELAQKLGLDETITRLPEGLDTQVGGGMVDTLSEGFRQRLVVVRSLLANPRVVLFDDANASFDSQNDERLTRLLESYRGSRTMIIVSHRPSILRICDRVFQLADGELTPGHCPAPRKPFRVALGSPREFDSECSTQLRI